jgi:two-component system CheB/CheR fusion protein
MVVFARHDLLADPPFTRLHLVVCRNLLVYFDPALERRLLPVFHHALLPGGLMFLGATDSPVDYEELFDNLDRRWKIFRRRAGASPRAALIPRVPAIYDAGPRFPYEAPQRNVFHQLIPPAVLVRPSGELVQVHGRTSELFDLPTGEPARFDIVQMARGNLAPELASALRDVQRTGRPVLRERVAVETAAGPLAVDVRVEPVRDESLAGTLLVAFERMGPPSCSIESESRARDAQRELERMRASYEELAEALEQSNLDLRASNEQLTSANEELMSANDELNAARADAQSLNEELRAVNAELRDKLEFISRQHVQLQTLLDTNRIAAVFVDRAQHICDYTREAGQLFDLHTTDLGRPFAQVVPDTQRPMVALVERVLQTLTPSEIELTGGDRAFVVRAAPYRTVGSRVDGVVVSICDVSRSKAVQDQDAILGALALSPTVVFALDRSGRIVWSCGPLFEHAASEAIGKSVSELFPNTLADRVLELGRRVVELRQPQRARAQMDEGREELDLFLQPLLAASGEIDGINAVMTRYERRTP